MLDSFFGNRYVVRSMCNYAALRGRVKLDLPAGGEERGTALVGGRGGASRKGAKTQRRGGFDGMDPAVGGVCDAGDGEKGLEGVCGKRVGFILECFVCYGRCVRCAEEVS